MSKLRIDVDLDKIRYNTRFLVDHLRPRGITVTGVTKAVCGPVAEGDHENCADIVKNGKRRKEQTQGGRHPASEKRQAPNHERRIGCHHGSPAVRPGLPGQQQNIERDRHHHATQSARERQGGLSRVSQSQTTLPGLRCDRSMIRSCEQTV